MRFTGDSIVYIVRLSGPARLKLGPKLDKNSVQIIIIIPNSKSNFIRFENRRLRHVVNIQ